MASIEYVKKVIEQYVKKNYRFVIVCGGGKLARSMQEVASAANNLSNEMLDWIGIHATKINAHLVNSIFDKISNENVVSNPTEKVKFKMEEVYNWNLILKCSMPIAAVEAYIFYINLGDFWKWSALAVGVFLSGLLVYMNEKKKSNIFTAGAIVLLAAAAVRLSHRCCAE